MAIHFQTMGQGTPLILIHGLFGTSDNLKALAKELADTYLVYLIDLPAHGDSDSVFPLTIPNVANTITEFIKEQGLNNVALLGHSLGGKMAMEIAISNPTLVSRLIVADIAPVQYTRRHDEIMESLNAVPVHSIKSRKEADQILAQNIPELGVRSFLLKSLVRVTSIKDATTINRPDKGNELKGWTWRFDLESLCKYYDELIKANSDLEYNGPTLFIIGNESDYVKKDYQPEIIKRFPAVQAKIIDGAGHWLHSERAVAFTKICRDFLSQ